MVTTTMNSKSAFSMIELMVVIAVIAVLAAIAAPALNNYINRAKVGVALVTLNSFNDYLKERYNTGTLTNTPITWAGFTFSDNSVTNVSTGNFDNVARIQYFAPGGYLGANNWMVCASVSGLISPPTNPGVVYNANNFTGSRICIRTVVNTTKKIANPTCGLWYNGLSGNAPDMSSTLLPTGCTCRFLANFSGC